MARVAAAWQKAKERVQANAETMEAAHAVAVQALEVERDAAKANSLDADDVKALEEMEAEG